MQDKPENQKWLCLHYFVLSALMIGTASFVAWLVIEKRVHHWLSYSDYASKRDCFNNALVILGALSLLHMKSPRAFSGPLGSGLGKMTQVLIVFWTLGVPLWFFVEYVILLPHANGVEFIVGAKLDELRALGDLASRVWAAAAVLGGLVLKNNIDGRKNSSERYRNRRRQYRYWRLARRRLAITQKQLAATEEMLKELRKLPKKYK